MLSVTWTSQFKKDYKLAKRRKKNLAKLRRVVDILSKELPLDEQCPVSLHMNGEVLRPVG